MEVLPKRTSVVKEEERKMEVVSVEEVDHKTGSDHKQTGGGDSSLKSSSSPNRKYSGLSNQGTMDISSRQSPSNPKGSIAINQKDDQLESTKAEMGEVREENERLKTLLARIVKDYQSLQMHFYDIVQQEQSKTPTESTPPPPLPPPLVHHIEDEEPELISLTLGTKSTTKKEDKVNNIPSKPRENIEEGLTLGLDCKFEGFSNGANGGPDSTSTNSTDEQKGDEGEGEETGEPWPPSKILKNMRNSGGDHDEVLQQQQTHVKKIRVSVRARCDAPTMHDGCQWRKYGQKIAKGNPCPRAYYRCTVAPACPVRKQVQRCAKDMSILITTYEGTHSHPLPISATAMASTTSAAASMLTSASSSTSSSLHPPPATISSFVNPNFSNINANAALNFNLPTMTNPTNNINPLSLYLPNPTISSSTAGPSHPTITLDLTSTPQFNTTTSSFPRYSTSFNFFSHSTTATNSVTLPLTSSSSSSSWNNGYLSNYYSAHLQPYNKGGPIGLGNKLHQQDSLFYQSYLQKFAKPTLTSTGQQQVLTDTVAKAITSDPSFKSALAAAITSYVGGTQSGGGGEEQGGTTGNGCGSGFMIRSGSASGSGSGTNTQQGGLAFLGTKSSASPVENRENLN